MLRAPIQAVKFNKTAVVALILHKNVKNVTVLAKTNETVSKKKIFTKYFLATNLCISMGASGLGDFIEQMSEIFYSSYQNDWNKLRTAKMAFTGLPVGLICHHFYILLDKYYFEKTLACMLKKIVLCQFVCSPLCIVTFYLTLGCLNNWSMKKISKDIIEKGSKILLAEWMIWPPALIFSFTFLSTRYRVLYDNVISLGFDVYNSYLVHTESSPIKEKKQIGK